MSKSADAFRTISEVAEWLDTPAHVLRFWESKFTQIKPVKRAGGRRYYRPADMRLLGGIKKLLHEDGMTIKGAQKVLREHGIKHVSSLCELSLGDEEDGFDDVFEHVPASEPVDTVVPFAKPEEATPDAVEPEAESEPVTQDLTGTEPVAEEPVEQEPPAEAPSAAEHDEAPSEIEHAELPQSDTTEVAPDAEPVDTDPASVVDPEVALADSSEDPAPAAEPHAEPETGNGTLPGFLQQSMDDRREDAAAESQPTREVPEPTPPPATIEPAPGALTHLSRITRLSAGSARQIAPILEQLKQVAR